MFDPKQLTSQVRQTSIEHLAQRVDTLRAEIRGRDPQQVAELTGSVYKDGIFQLHYWSLPVAVVHPDLRVYYRESGLDLSEYHQALVLYYFVTCDGTPPTGRWVSFAELPDGRFYNKAFQGYTGGELTRAFGDDLTSFNRAAQALGGHSLPYGDSAYVFKILPNVSLAVVCWCGDEDFPSSYQVLFDAAASHHFPTDACAILGSNLSHKLITAKDA